MHRPLPPLSKSRELLDDALWYHYWQMPDRAVQTIMKVIRIVERESIGQEVAASPEVSKNE